MADLFNKTLLTGSLCLIAACSNGGGGGGDDGGGGDGGGGNDDVQQSALFFGSTDPDASRSGLDYADGTQSIEDLEGEPLNVRVALIQGDRTVGVDDFNTSITDEVLTLTPGSEGDSFSITLNGETVAFVNRDAVTGDQPTLRGFDLSFFSDFEARDHVRVMRVIDSNIQETFTIGHFVIGFETAPGSDALTTGSATYQGDVEGFSNVGDLSESDLDGGFTLNASFADSQIDGRVILSPFDTAFGRGTADFDLAPTDITGNGFAGGLTVTACSFEVCTGDAEIAGAFFGPNADEVGGVITFDLDVTNADGDLSEAIGNR